MKLKQTILAIGFLLSNITAAVYAQSTPTLPKVSHAEPLYFDLVRDLGARKGEKEINVGGEYKRTKNYEEKGFLVEYEWAPINRLGFEVEADFAFFNSRKHSSESTTPGNKLDCIKLATQYSFYVNPKINTTLAIGYTQLFELNDFSAYGHESLVKGTTYNPFFVAAKSWSQQRLHTMLITGPMINQDFESNKVAVDWQIHASVHYYIPNTRHFVGLEFNNERVGERWYATIRPQFKLKVNERLAVGLVGGIPIHQSNQQGSGFVRIIYEP